MVSERSVGRSGDDGKERFVAEDDDGDSGGVGGAKEDRTGSELMSRRRSCPFKYEFSDLRKRTAPLKDSTCRTSSISQNWRATMVMEGHVPDPIGKRFQDCFRRLCYLLQLVEHRQLQRDMINEGHGVLAWWHLLD